MRVALEDIPKVLKEVKENSIKLKCIICRTPLPPIISMYPMDNGEHWWIYIECFKCGYQNALRKLLKIIQEEV